MKAKIKININVDCISIVEDYRKSELRKIDPNDNLMKEYYKNLEEADFNEMLEYIIFNLKITK